MSSNTLIAQKLAWLGGPWAVESHDADLFRWPIITEEDEQAVLAALRAGDLSASGTTMEFESEYAGWQGTEFALSYPNGTMALLAAMWAIGLRRGDEFICPSMTYWASALPALSLGATPVFADIDPVSLCIDPTDIEHRITRRTRAIVVVHYCGHPCDMDPILELAAARGLPVLEDNSHAHGTLYRGRMTGALGNISAASLMSGKSLPAGEAGMACTDNREYLERMIAFSHYARHPKFLTLDELKPLAGMPQGGVKGRLSQMTAAFGRVQLRHYPARMAEIQKAMNRFWDLLEGTPGLRAHRPDADSGSTMGGWYNPLGHYLPEELGGLPVERFIEAVKAEGGLIGRGCNTPLHLHPVFNEADIYGDGKPTRIAHADRDLRQPAGSLPHTEALAGRCFGIPWFKHDRPEQIERMATAYRKVALQHEALLG